MIVPTAPTIYTFIKFLDLDHEVGKSATNSIICQFYLCQIKKINFLLLEYKLSYQGINQGVFLKFKNLGSIKVVLIGVHFKKNEFGIKLKYGISFEFAC